MRKSMVYTAILLAMLVVAFFQEATIVASPDVEELYTNAFDATYVQWAEVGASPYLHNTDADYIKVGTNGYQEGDWTFPTSAGSGTINSVKLRFENYVSLADIGAVTAYVWDGASWVNVGGFGGTYTTYTWEEIDVSTTLNTWAKINGAKVRLKYTRYLSGTQYVRRLTRKVDYTPSANNPPSISSPELLDSGETTNKNNTALTVNTEYHINFTISDTNTLADIKNVTIRIWNSALSTENGTNQQANHYSFTWIESTDTWTGYPSSSYFISGADPGTGSSATSYQFRLAFKLSKVARYSSATTTWKISIFVWDDSNAGANNRQLMFGVSFYSEISITDSTHSWSGLSPNTSNNQVGGDGDIDFSIITNDNWKAQAKSNGNPTKGSDIIPLSNLKFHKDTLGSAISMTTSYQDVGGLTNQSPPPDEASPTATFLTLWISIPNGTPSGNYTYTLYIQVVQQL